MNLITHPTPKSNENDLKFESNNQYDSLSAGHWCRKYNLSNHIINLDHVISIKKTMFGKRFEDTQVLIFRINFETMKETEYLYFDSEKSRDEYYDMLQRISILPII